ASLVACARQGLVSVDVVAGDGTKVKADASMAASATAGQLEIEIAELEALLAAEVDAWFAQAQAADAAEDALFGEGENDGGAGPGAGGATMTLARLTDKIVRRQRAKARLDAEAAARQAQAEAEHAGKITRLERRTAARRADAERLAAEADAKVEDYQRRAAAKAAAGSRKRPDGRVPLPADRHIAVRRARQAAERASTALEQAKAAPAAPDEPGRRRHPRGDRQSLVRRRVRQRRQLHHHQRAGPVCRGHQRSPPNRPHPRRQTARNDETLLAAHGRPAGHPRRQSPLQAPGRHDRAGPPPAAQPPRP